MLFFLFLSLSFAYNPGGCPHIWNNGHVCDIRCCVSHLNPAPRDNNQKPKDLGYWFDTVEQIVDQERGTCFLKYKGNNFPRYYREITHGCPYWEIKEQTDDTVLVLDKSKERDSELYFFFWVNFGGIPLKGVTSVNICTL